MNRKLTPVVPLLAIAFAACSDDTLVGPANGSHRHDTTVVVPTLLVQMRDPEDKPTANLHESRGQGMMLRGYDPTALPPEAQRSM